MKSLLSKLCSIENVNITFHETWDEDDNDELFCLACADLVIGCPTYIRTDKHGDRVYLHKSCAELPGKIRHPLHPQHTLTVHRPLRYGFICDGCRHVSFGLRYRCEECKFKLDLQCASKNEGQALKEIVEKDTIYHPHKLQQIYFHSSMPTYRSDDKLSQCFVCCCCVKCCLDGRDPTYTCNVCFESKSPFFIHRSCLDRVPRQVQSSFHPERPLFIQRVDDVSLCLRCDNWITGLALTCEKCRIKFHVSCGSRTTRGLRLKLHRHDMHYVTKGASLDNICIICEVDCAGTAFYRCVECGANVHMECIRLPEIVEHESHEYHPLKLTDSVVTHRDDDEYCCDICEEEGNIKHHCYYCNECNYIAHIECVHSEREDDTSPKIPCLESKTGAKSSFQFVELDEYGGVENDDALMESNDAVEISYGMKHHERYRLRGKDKAENENEDPDVENEDIREETEDAEKHDATEIFFPDRDTPSYCSNNSEHQQYDKSDVDDSIINIRRRIEGLALRLEAIANLDKRIGNVKADMVELVFQLDHHRKKFIYRK